MCYTRTQCVPRSKYSAPRLSYKTNLLMLCKGEVAVCCEIRTKTQCENHVEFLNVKPGGTEALTFRHHGSYV
jgi:hypothetical protein